MHCDQDQKNAKNSVKDLQKPARTASVNKHPYVLNTKIGVYPGGTLSDEEIEGPNSTVYFPAKLFADRYPKGSKLALAALDLGGKKL